MFFSVTNTYYPIYDVNNLYNTNSNFDYGGFRALIEAQAQTATSATLFAYKFTDPGVYSFYLSTDINKKMYISVMPQNVQCTSTGPFYPTTPTNIVASGISVSDSILKDPDWLIIFILLACALLATIIMLIILILFRKYGWSKTSYLYPFYRIMANHYNFDDYSSKGSTVYPVRKYHRNLHALTAAESGTDLALQSAVLDAGAVEVKNDDFWDYDRQVDLEGFDSGRVYDTLDRQARGVTQTIGQHKDSMKLMYQRLADQSESLKGLWAAKMNLKGTSGLATDDDLAEYERRLESLDLELERRKDLGRQFQAVLDRQAVLQEDDEASREKHQVSFQTSLREASRLLTQHLTHLQQSGDSTHSDDSEGRRRMHEAVDQRVALLLEKMADDSKAECKRTGAWGVLGEGIGGQLVEPGSNRPLTRSDLFTDTMNVKATNLIYTDEVTGLVKPKLGVQMVTADGMMMSVPRDCFLHPQTGRVLPIQGNVAFDPVTSRLVFVVDSATGEATRSDDPYIPYVPYPTDPKTGQRVDTRLKPMTNKTDLRWGLPMSDPALGLHVPILAMTTGSVIPVGGVHVDPVTGLPVPIELGSMMADPNSGQAVPILAVTLDPETGVVVPIGGTKEGGHSTAHLPIIPGDDYVDPTSRRSVRVHSGHLAQGTVSPSAGSYQALLDSTVLACEVRAIDAVREFKDALYAAGLRGGSVNVRHEEANMAAALKEVAKTREKMKALRLRSLHDIERRKERAAILAATGGSPGMYEFTKTGQLLPILIGTTMLDPSGSGLDVPILGAERDIKSGRVVPLAGSMEDPEGGGLVPITIGRKAVDPVSGELSPVIGVRRSTDTKMAIPVTLSSAAHRKPRPPPGALALLEEELVARRGYWRRQRAREGETTLKQHELAVELMFFMDDVSTTSVQKSLDHLDTLIQQLSEAARAECQRRGAATSEISASGLLPAHITAILTAGDKVEAERDEAHIAMHTRFSELVRKFFGKLRSEEDHHRGRMEGLEGAMNVDAENMAIQRYRQAKLRLQGELREQLKTRVETLDEGHSSLEYAREFSELCAKEAKVVLTRSAFLAGDYDAQLTGVYGDVTDAAGQDSELIPLLRQLIAMLEAGGPFYLSPDFINFINNGGNTASSTTNNNITNINISGISGASAIHTLSERQPDGRREARTDTTLNVRGAAPDNKASPRGPADGWAGPAMQNTGVVVIGDMSRAKTQGTLTDEEQADRKRFLWEKQAYEAARLENDLHNAEVQTMNETVTQVEAEKEAAGEKLAEELKRKLAKLGPGQDAEKERLILEYKQNMADLDQRLENQKQAQLEEIRAKLLNRRRRERKELHAAHIAEAQGYGISAEEVPDIPALSHDEMDADLKRLQEEQEKLNSEVKMANIRRIDSYSDEIDLDLNPEFYRNLGLSSDELDRFMKLVREKTFSTALANTLVTKLKARRESKLSPEEEEERRASMDAREVAGEADSKSEDQRLMRVLVENEKDQQRLAEQEALQEILRNATDEERARIMAQFEDQRRRLNERLSDQKEADLDKVKAKVAARKRMREQLGKDKAVEKELDRMTKAHVASDDPEAVELMTNISDQMTSEKLTNQQQALIDDQLKRQEALDRQFAEDGRKLDRELEEERTRQNSTVDEQIDQQMKLVLDGHKAKFDRDILLQGKKLSKEEYQKLLEKFHAEQETLRKNMEDERGRQKKTLDQKLEERRAKRKQQLQEGHDLDLAEELVKQQQERDALNDKLSKEVEGSALKSSLKGKNGKQAENMIYAVLRQRHTREAIHLEEQLALARVAAIKKARAAAEEMREKERERLLSAFEQEMLELMGNAGSLSHQELEDKRAQLQAAQKKQLSEFDELTTRLVDKAEKDILPELDISETNSRLELKEKQLQELADAMRKFSPVDELRKKYAEEAKRAKDEMERYKKEVLSKMKKELDRQKEEQRKREEERRHKMMAQLKQLEKDLEEEHKREVERQKERAAEKERLRAQQLEERKKREKEEIEKANLSEEEKKRLLKEHGDNMKQLEASLKQEQAKSESNLAAKLEARRQRRKGAAVAALERVSQHDLDDQRRRELDMDASSALLFGGVTKEEGAKLGSSPTSGSGGQGSSFQGFQSSGQAEQDWVNLLMMSPLFKQISDLEDLLAKADTTPGAASSSASTGPSSMVYGADYTKAYIDVKDAQWVCKGDLTPVDISAISPSQFVIYRFGVFLTRLLHQTIDTPEVTLLLASNLPPNNYSKNAFRNSIFYEHAKKILFIRRERMDSIGEFVMVIVHSLAHIKSGDLTDDSRPLFMRDFYKALRVVCQDMFFSRSRNTPASHGLIGSSPADDKTKEDTRPVLERALTGVRSMDDRTNVVSELLDVKVNTSEYTSQKMSQRLYGYESLASNARLRQQLAARGGYSTSGDFIASRMAELKGQKSPLANPTRSPVKRMRPAQTISSPRELLGSQIVSLRTKSDGVNEELAKVMKAESEIREGMTSLPESSDKLSDLRERLTTTLVRKEELIRTVTVLEDEIAQKEKAAKKKKYAWDVFIVIKNDDDGACDDDNDHDDDDGGGGFGDGDYDDDHDDDDVLVAVVGGGRGYGSGGDDDNDGGGEFDDGDYDDDHDDDDVLIVVVGGCRGYGSGGDDDDDDGNDHVDDFEDDENGDDNHDKTFANNNKYKHKNNISNKQQQQQQQKNDNNTKQNTITKIAKTQQQ
ncbi:cytadherence high molecular weight protein 2 [Plakobranchus ocellatus]|uniref:Cytadherence high molecular weight protein 2 n=1 Tax=Plakobranchus ocellatus TaxID=259542 RepID=A0AAV4C4B2_9GAST|nr:cytadherence high molecular weight protein 2 [Plakobranchus ocellatus]